MSTASPGVSALRTPCSLCFTDQDVQMLINLAGYPVCRSCLETASRDLGAPRRRLLKIRRGKQVAGVCGGVADYANFDRDTFRVIFFIAAALTGFAPFLIAYVVLAFFLPTEP